MPPSRGVAVLGATGSIGTSCLEVLAAHRTRLHAVGLAAHRNWQRLREQAAQFHPRWVVVTDATQATACSEASADHFTRWYFGEEILSQLVRQPEVDTVVCAIVGAAGLKSAWAAIEAGKRLALANKETLVVAGPLISRRCAETGAQIIPVDSEHSAIFQALQGGRRNEVRKIILTASGGPFRGWTRQQLRDVSVAQALHHPTWTMGRKITVDSATLMNKALEIIEARWLFQLEPEQIEIAIHPQSVVHSLVEYIDGSTLAQLSPPDMKLPIQYALTYPERWPGISPRMTWNQRFELTFEPPDREAFPAIALGYEVARRGGTCGAVLNAANEVAVQRFLEGTLRFDQIVDACRDVLHHHSYDPQPTLDQLWRLDAWAREETWRWK
ncbi:MAG: 1-deoxy-D-xylulose 5-phosphate reductoisomerase [Planctomycetaceae bacterium]|nr:MAG: 1-deoxy-D-xylulose 5-phosphate reductoisomerase [Planctomycetaceae bacterium]